MKRPDRVHRLLAVAGVQRRGARVVFALGFALIAAALGSGPASSQGGSDAAAGTRPDSLGVYLRSLADSTDRYFGISAAPVDTAGLDSALAYGLAHPVLERRREGGLRAGPWVSFDRAEGALWGGTLGWGREARAGDISARLGAAVGPNEWRGGARYAKRWEGPRETAPRWTLEVSGGRFAAVLDPDLGASFLRVARALIEGSDRQHYFLREGVRVAVERESRAWRAGLAIRDQIEIPLTTTTTWNLLRKTPEVIFNQPAARGRVRELRAAAAARLPLIPLQVEGSLATSSDALGSDFGYDRARVVIGGELPLGGIAAAVPQLEYGRLTGAALPQASFFLGGHHSLRSLPAEELGGTTKALARLDVFFTPDLLALAHLPHPAALPIQGALFAATGAVAGGDPYGGPAATGDRWPEREAWRSELGGGLLYRPGLPNPRGSLRVNWAWPLGTGHGGRVSMEYAVPLDLLRALE